MAFFTGLCFIAAFLWSVGALFGVSTLLDFRYDALLSSTVMFTAIGLMHFAKPQSLVYMIDNFLPYPKLLVFLSGALEIILGIGLLFPATRQVAAWGLIVLLVGMFPANINVALNQLPPPGGLPAKAWYVWSRLAFQPVYIVWIWWAALR